MILGRRHNNGYETESNFVDCLGKNLRSAVLPNKSSSTPFYPWFEPRTAPWAPPIYQLFSPTKRSLSASDGLGVRYMIWVDGTTNTTDQAVIHDLHHQPRRRRMLWLRHLGPGRLLRSDGVGSKDAKNAWAYFQRRQWHLLHAGYGCPRPSLPGSRPRPAPGSRISWKLF